MVCDQDVRRNSYFCGYSMLTVNIVTVNLRIIGDSVEQKAMLAWWLALCTFFNERVQENEAIVSSFNTCSPL